MVTTLASHKVSTSIFELTQQTETNESLVTEIFQSRQSEKVWITIKLEHESMLLGCVYRPPTSSNNKHTNKLFELELNNNISLAKKLMNKKLFDGMIIAGDFNFPYIKWSKRKNAKSGSNIESFGYAFVNLLSDKALVQNVNKPTFQKSETEQTNTLDYIISDSPKRIDHIKHLPPLDTTKQGQMS